MPAILILAMTTLWRSFDGYDMHINKEGMQQHARAGLAHGHRYKMLSLLLFSLMKKEAKKSRLKEIWLKFPSFS